MTEIRKMRFTVEMIKFVTFNMHGFSSCHKLLVSFLKSSSKHFVLEVALKTFSVLYKLVYSSVLTCLFYFVRSLNYSGNYDFLKFYYIWSSSLIELECVFYLFAPFLVTLSFSIHFLSIIFILYFFSVHVFILFRLNYFTHCTFFLWYIMYKHIHSFWNYMTNPLWNNIFNMIAFKW